MLTNKQRKLNDFIIKEAGLELDNNNHVIDQDTGMPIIIKGKSVKYNNTPVVRLLPNEIEFDPLNNSLLANEICNNYITKLHNEGELDSVIYGISNKERNMPGQAMCINNGTASVVTPNFNLDSLKYISLIATLNGTDIDSKDTIKLKSYDQKVKTPRTRR